MHFQEPNMGYFTIEHGSNRYLNEHKAINILFLTLMSLLNTCVANLEVVTEIFSVSHTGQRQIIARLTVLILNLLLWIAL